jgi:hypothetical protein
LWEPLPGDHGAHGRFDARAKNSSLHLTMNLNRTPLLIAGACVLAGILLARRL